MAEEPVQEPESEPPAPLALPVPTSGGDLSIVQIARAMVASGYFPNTRLAAQAVVKILAGKELGLGPVASMMGVYIISTKEGSGRIGLGSNMIGALIKKSGKYDYRIKTHTSRECEIEFYQRTEPSGWEIVGSSVFTFEDARTAGLLRPGSPWQTYPRNMLFARALTNGARWYCPDVLTTGVYTPDELAGGIVPPDIPEQAQEESNAVQDQTES